MLEELLEADTEPGVGDDHNPDIGGDLVAELVLCQLHHGLVLVKEQWVQSTLDEKFYTNNKSYNSYYQGQSQ